jgi:hypothetical protein
MITDQQENKSRVLPRLLFYGNVCLSLIVHIFILAIHVLLVAYLAKNQLLINLLMLVWKSFLGNLAYLIVLNLEIKTLTKMFL